MLTNAKIDELFGIKESYQAPDVLMKVLFDKGKREELFKKFLEHEVNLDNDWFHIYFEEEHSNKAKLNQDFTPMAVASVLSQLAGNGPGMNLDVAAGSGGITIKKWVDDKMAIGFFEYRPSLCFYQCEELSDRALPFLLFNLAIRGMNAAVLHGDTLTRKFKQVYFLQNDEDGYTTFSNINIMPHSDACMQYFDIREWLEEPKRHIESIGSETRYLYQGTEDEEQLSLF